MTRDLDLVLEQALALLAEGAAGPGGTWRTLTLGSVGLDDAPRLRSVVLRGFDPALPEAEIHTDARSGKVAEFRARPAGCLHRWDQSRAIQLRLSGQVSLHRDDGLADAAWSSLRDESRDVYRMTPAPGTALASPEDARPRLDDAAARAVFVVLRLRVAELEWLHLAREGHRRAVFRWADGGCAGMWLAP